MTNKPTEEFKREAVRIALTSGLPREQAADLGVGHSTLDKGVKAFADTGTAPSAEAERVKEIERLRREARIVMEEGKRQERPRPSLRAKSGEVCVHCRISRPALPGAGMPVVRCQSARVTHLAALVA